MNWTYSIRQKTVASILLGAVFVFIILNNIYERRNMSKLKESFSSIYKDRLLAESYIYLLSDLLHEHELIKEANISKELIDEKILLLIKDYESTYLTKEELAYFESLKKLLLADVLQDKYSIAPKLNYASIYVLLDRLSKIQVEEGTRLNIESSNRFLGSDLSFKLELAFLIVIGLIIQALIFASKTSNINNKNINLN